MKVVISNNLNIYIYMTLDNNISSNEGHMALVLSA